MFKKNQQRQIFRKEGSTSLLRVRRPILRKKSSAVRRRPIEARVLHNHKKA